MFVLIKLSQSITLKDEKSWDLAQSPGSAPPRVCPIKNTRLHPLLVGEPDSPRIPRSMMGSRRHYAFGRRHGGILSDWALLIGGRLLSFLGRHGTFGGLGAFEIGGITPSEGGIMTLGRQHQRAAAFLRMRDIMIS